MAVIYLKEKPEQRGADKSQEGTTYTRHFQARTDSITDDAYTLWGATATGTTLPDIGDAHPSDPNAYCVKIDPKAQDDPQLWLIQVNYSTASGGRKDPDPINWDPVISFGQVNIHRALNKHYDYTSDVRGEPSLMIQASSLKEFNPPLTQDEQLLVINIKRNIAGASFDSVNPNTFTNTINDAAITIAGIYFDVGFGRCRKYSAVKRWSPQGSVYWAEDIDIVYNPETWVRKVIDISLYKLDASNNPVRIRDARGNPVQTPVLLDGLGAPLDPQTLDPVFLDFNTYWEENWSLMGLPASE